VKRSFFRELVEAGKFREVRGCGYRSKMKFPESIALPLITSIGGEGRGRGGSDDDKGGIFPSTARVMRRRRCASVLERVGERRRDARSQERLSLRDAVTP